MHSIVEISVMKTVETCRRTRFYVKLTTDEGFSTTPSCYSTGSVHLDAEGKEVVVPGLTVEEARFRALHDADDWGDLLGIAPTPFEDEGVLHQAERPMRRWTTRRVIADRRRAAGEQDCAED